MGITLIRNRLKFISKYLQLFLFYMLFLFLSLFLFLRCFWKKNNKYETKMGIRTQKIYFILVSEDSETNLNASHCWHALFLFYLAACALSFRSMQTNGIYLKFFICVSFFRSTACVPNNINEFTEISSLNYSIAAVVSTHLSQFRVDVSLNI